MRADDSSDQPEAPESIAEVVADAWHADFSLDLGREETAFLAGIHACSVDSPKLGIDGETLRRIFALVYELSQSDGDSETQRATLTIGRLRTQGILSRSDDAGVMQDGEFTLSPLGWKLAESMQKERELNKHDLSYMLMHMRAVLAGVIRDAEQADVATYWEDKVFCPLRNIVVEMIRLIEQRQRGLDAAHRGLRKDITQLVTSEWADAIDRCVEMIEHVHRTLGELNEVLSNHVQHLDTQLYTLASYANKHVELPKLVDRTRNQLERLASWGNRRYEDWSSYYRNVQIYIRDVIRTDPDNLLRNRLTNQIRRYQARPYCLVSVARDPFLHLRDVIRPAASMTLQVPDDVLFNQKLVQYAQPLPDRVDLALAAIVERFKSEERIDIVAAACDVAPDFTDDDYFRLLILATPALLKLGMTASQIYEQGWVKLSEHLHAQTLRLHVRHERQSSVDAVEQPFTPSLPVPDEGAHP